MLASGAISWRSKTQSTTVLSSTEAKFYVAISATKVYLFIPHVLHCLGQPPTGSTIIYEDNKACIKVINACYPTDHTQHTETPYFNIQDW